MPLLFTRILSAGKAPLAALCLLLLCAAAPARAATGCLACHADMARGFAPAHAFAAKACSRCHAGNPAASTLPAAHRGLRAYPGQLDNAAETCGGCHRDKVEAVSHSLMATGTGMVRSTRQAFGEPAVHDGHADLAHLGHGPADELLRKQCASCHLGQPKRFHHLNPTTDRGGGCLACHINQYPAHAHPALSAKVSDARCFGCHSRSGRIALNYAGLAETDAADATLHLEDGRAVERRPDDVHHAAGMGCTDCHTEVGIMGIGQHAEHKATAVDIGCRDCHDNRAPRLDPAHWPAQFRALRARVPFPITADTRFLVTTRHGTPLWNIAVRPDGNWLYPKRGGPPLRIPAYTAATHPRAGAHRRLTCNACHSQWAPQCYSCHLSYDPNGKQWDHAAHAFTPGAWHERRGDIRSGLPPLGVNANGRIVPVVPGMIMTVEHPGFTAPHFQRRFAPLSPHTTGPARSCASCHRTSATLGLGEGQLMRKEGTWVFRATKAPLQDGLPADAWTSLDGKIHGKQGDSARPMSAAEMRRILGATIEPTH